MAGICQRSVLFALFAAIAFYISGSTTVAAPTAPHMIAAQVLDGHHPDAAAAIAPYRSGAPCRQHEALAHHACSQCTRCAVTLSSNRSRDRSPAMPAKDARPDKLAERLALEARNAAARLILARGAVSSAESSSRTVLARTARLRN
jgi:hypothetical protein